LLIEELGWIAKYLLSSLQTEPVNWAADMPASGPVAWDGHWLYVLPFSERALSHVALFDAGERSLTV